VDSRRLSAVLKVICSRAIPFNFRPRLIVAEGRFRWQKAPVQTKPELVILPWEPLEAGFRILMRLPFHPFKHTDLSPSHRSGRSRSLRRHTPCHRTPDTVLFRVGLHLLVSSQIPLALCCTCLGRVFI